MSVEGTDHLIRNIFPVWELPSREEDGLTDNLHLTAGSWLGARGGGALTLPLQESGEEKESGTPHSQHHAGKRNARLGREWAVTEQANSTGLGFQTGAVWGVGAQVVLTFTFHKEQWKGAGLSGSFLQPLLTLEGGPLLQRVAHSFRFGRWPTGCLLKRSQNSATI